MPNTNSGSYIKHVCCAVSLESYRSKAHGGCTGVTIRLRSQSAVRHHGQCQCQEWSVTLDIGHMVTHTTLIILLCDFLSSLTSPRVILSRYYQRNAHEMRSRLLLALTDEALSGRCCPWVRADQWLLSAPDFIMQVRVEEEVSWSWARAEECGPVQSHSCPQQSLGQPGTVRLPPNWVISTPWWSK